MTKTFWFFDPVLFIARSMPAHSDHHTLRFREWEMRFIEGACERSSDTASASG